MRFLAGFEPQAYAAFRIVFAFLYLQHGAQKLFGILGGEAQPLLSVAGAAGVIEFFGGLLIAVGFMTTPTAFICSGQMAVAYFWRHQPGGALPILNRGELAVLFCFAFLLIATRGAGIWSVDGEKRRR